MEDYLVALAEWYAAEVKRVTGPQTADSGPNQPPPPPPRPNK